MRRSPFAIRCRLAAGGVRAAISPIRRLPRAIPPVSPHLREISTKSSRNFAAPVSSPANPPPVTRDQLLCRCTAASRLDPRPAGPPGHPTTRRLGRTGTSRAGGQDEQSCYCGTRNPYCLPFCNGSAAPLVAPPDPFARPARPRPGCRAQPTARHAPVFSVRLSDTRRCRLQPARLLIRRGDALVPRLPSSGGPGIAAACPAT